MIAFIRGKLVDKRPTQVLVDVNGMGYRVLIPTSTYEKLPDAGEPVRLLTHHYVREDAIHLYGFVSDAERHTFEAMVGVTGVGPKLALAALSAMSPADLRSHVTSGDVGFLTSIPGVGRKTAERLVIELRDRLPAADDVESASAAGAANVASVAERADALAALEQLGYSRAAGEKALRSVLKRHPEVKSADELVRRALRET